VILPEKLVRSKDGQLLHPNGRDNSLHTENEPHVRACSIAMLHTSVQGPVFEDVGLHRHKRGKRSFLKRNQPVAVGTATFWEDRNWDCFAFSCELLPLLNLLEHFLFALAVVSLNEQTLKNMFCDVTDTPNPPDLLLCNVPWGWVMQR